MESPLYKRLRTALYDADPVDREVGPECRLKMRGVRAFLMGGKMRRTFEEFFPRLSDEIFAEVEQLARDAAAHIVSVSCAHLRRYAAAGAEPVVDTPGAKLGAYLCRALGENQVMSSLLARPDGSDTAYKHVVQLAHLDVMCRFLCPQMEPVPF